MKNLHVCAMAIVAFVAMIMVGCGAAESESISDLHYTPGDSAEADGDAEVAPESSPEVEQAEVDAVDVVQKECSPDGMRECAKGNEYVRQCVGGHWSYSQCAIGKTCVVSGTNVECVAIAVDGDCEVDAEKESAETDVVDCVTCCYRDSDCDDGNSDTRDTCEGGVCKHNDTCDDGNPCTTGDHLVKGVCQGTAIDCGSSGTCVSTPSSWMCVPSCSLGYGTKVFLPSGYYRVGVDETGKNPEESNLAVGVDGQWWGTSIAHSVWAWSWPWGSSSVAPVGVKCMDRCGVIYPAYVRVEGGTAIVVCTTDGQPPK